MVYGDSYHDVVGRRVVLRRRIDAAPGDSSLTDAVGDVLAAGEQIVLRRRDGQRIVVPATDVQILRPVDAAPRAVLALAETAAAGWPAPETEWLSGWLLRAAAGYTKRANSVLPLRDPGMPLDQALSRVQHWYADRRLPARVQVPLPARASLDAALHLRGWKAEAPTVVQTTPIEVLADRTRAGLPTCQDAAVGHRDEAADTATVGAVSLDALPSARWLSAYHRSLGSMPTSDSAELLDVAAKIMTAAAHPVFAMLEIGGEVTAIGRAVVDDGWLGITALEVAPSFRRRGLATRVLAAIARWGTEHGADSAYLQVMEGNGGALALYRRLGFWTHHRYQYRVWRESSPAP